VEFPDKNAEFVIPVALFMPQIVGQLLSIKYINSLPFECSVITMTLINMFISYSMPFMVHLLSQAGYNDLAWKLVLAELVVFAVYSAIVNALLTGFYAQFPEKKTGFVGMFFAGAATNALIVLMIQVVVLLAMNANDTYRTSIAYFVTAGAIITSCVFAFICWVL